ncbi:MAG: phosphoglucosamine mutase [Methanobrevibacter thaueri]|jgi:phosphoglucosamine mutase|uniref:phosphoglucosamine mutase n=1 Tax=Methanobrevibacter thaueri TaxID=190975 RepID=UPI0026EBA564|nr:phosphoglucosamine mutase [Methanobrevibacter thaueri]MBE6495184.1 phosphoglucosamine mutase [Methanobrevibacter thaueri]
MAAKKLFGTSGIRGKIGSEVTCELALNVGKSLAHYLGNEGSVVLGYDTRTTNKMLDQAIAAGLLESGVDVIKIGMVPTPLVGYATEKLDADAGIMLTASHNPSQYNGIKLWNKNGMAYTSNQEKEIEEIYANKAYTSVTWDKVGKLSVNEEIKGKYVDDLVDMVDIKEGLKVVIDCASGAGSEISPLVFRKAGCEVTTLNSQPDGFFPGRNPEPNAENLQTLMKTVVAVGADLGIAHDGDADRMITVDEKGNISPFDSLLALISKEFDGDIVTTVDAGLCMDESVSGKVYRTPVGDVNVAEVIIEKDASFGGEPSGTWLHPDFCMCPDGILSGLRMAELVSNKGKLSDLLDEIPSYPNIREKITCSKEAKIKVMENMEDLLKGAFDDIVEVNSVDGVRLTFADDSWVLVRPSGTEDYVRITLESRDEARAEEIKETCVKIINENL